LRFVEDDHVLMGRFFRGTAETLLKKIIDVLYAGPRVAPNISEARSLSGAPAAQVFVSG
jgi:hypothetical protein